MHPRIEPRLDPKRTKQEARIASQNAEENSSGEDDDTAAGPAPAAAAQTRHVNGDQARHIAELERRLAAAQVTIQR